MMCKRYFLMLAGASLLTIRPVFGNVTPAEAGDKVVLGHWRFDGTTEAERKSDSSLYGSAGITALQSDVTVVGSGGFSGGYLNSTVDNGTATATLANGVPDLSTYHTLGMRFKPNKAMASGSDDLSAILKDTAHWHFMALRYQKGKANGSKYSYAVLFDPRYDAAGVWRKPDGSAGSAGDLEVAGDSAQIPIAVNGKTVTMGGSLSFNSRTVNFMAGMDEVIVVNRMMSKWELTRLYQTGETYIWLTSNNQNGGVVSFGSGVGWSSCESSLLRPTPGEYPGAAYIVDGNNQLYCTADGVSFSDATTEKTKVYTAKFGGDNHANVSLTLGRNEDLVNITEVDGSGNHPVLVSSGGAARLLIYGGAGTQVAIDDFRLNRNSILRILCPGLTLSAASLTVNAPKDAPVVLSTDSGGSCKIVGTAKGAGYLQLAGGSDLDLLGLKGDFRLDLTGSSAGKIKTKQLYSYRTKGTVIVDTDGPVVFKDDGEIDKGSDTRVNIAFETQPPNGRYHIVTLPSKYADPSEEVLFPCKVLSTSASVSGNIVREGREVYAEFPVGDFGSVPLVIGE